MKYIKEFENIVENPEFLKSILSKFLEKVIASSTLIIFTRDNNQYQPEYIESVSIRQKRTYNNFFQINMNYLKDNKLKLDPVKHKQKVRIQLISYNSGLPSLSENEKEIITVLKDFMNDVLTRHSFSSKKSDDWYNHQDSVDFFINTSEIDNIVKELNNDFEYYQTMKKYNL